MLRDDAGTVGTILVRLYGVDKLYWVPETKILGVRLSERVGVCVFVRVRLCMSLGSEGRRGDGREHFGAGLRGGQAAWYCVCASVSSCVWVV